MIVGNYGNDCVCYEAVAADPARSDPPPSTFFTLPNWRHFRTKYSQSATAVLLDVKEGRPYAERESATTSPTNTNTSAPCREKEYNCVVEQRENMWDAAVEQRRVHLLGEIDH